MERTLGTQHRGNQVPILSIPNLGTTTRADTSATPNTIVLRDSSGNVTHNAVTANIETVNSVNWTTATKAVSYNLGLTETTIFADASAAVRTYTLPTVSGLNGRIYEVMKIDSSANTVTINCADAATINGAATKVLSTQYSFARFKTDGSNWFLF